MRKWQKFSGEREENHKWEIKDTRKIKIKFSIWKDMVKILHHLGSASSRYALASVFSEAQCKVEYG